MEGDAAWRQGGQPLQLPGWQRVAPQAETQGQSIMLRPYSVPDEARMDQAALEELGWVKGFILGVRRIRAEMNISPGKTLPLCFQHGSDREQRWLKNNTLYITRLARIEEPRLVEGESSPDMATALAGDMTLLIPLAGIIDREVEAQRLATEIAKLRQEHARSTGKLADVHHVERAPLEVVAKERQRTGELEVAIARLAAQIQKLESWG